MARVVIFLAVGLLCLAVAQCADEPAAAEVEADEIDEVGADYDMWMTKADRKTECQDKLQIVKEIYSESESEDFADTASIVNAANGDGYPENSLGYVWCARLEGGIQSAKDDVKNNIEIIVAPYLDTDKLPMTTGEVDELGGNSLESDALKAIVDHYEQDWFQSEANFNDDNMALKESQYIWSGAASLDKQAPDIAPGGAEPTKTALSRVFRHSTKNELTDDVYLCSCGIETSDMSQETGLTPGDDSTTSASEDSGEGLTEDADEENDAEEESADSESDSALDNDEGDTESMADDAENGDADEAAEASESEADDAEQPSAEDGTDSSDDAAADDDEGSDDTAGDEADETPTARRSLRSMASTHRGYIETTKTTTTRQHNKWLKHTTKKSNDEDE